MKKTHHPIFAMLFLSLSMILTACQIISSRSLVFNAQCVAPCWRNIKPGETSFQSSVDTIKTISGINSKDTFQTGPRGIFNDTAAFHLISGEDIEVYEIVDHVSLIVIYDLKGITFQEGIDNYGNPEYITRTTITDDAAHHWLYAMNLQKGIIFGYETHDSSNLGPATKVSEVYYFDPAEYKILLDSHFLLYDVEGGEPHLFPWSGYGNINWLYPHSE